MPEEAIEAPAAPAGIDAMMAQLDAASAAGKNIAAPATPAAPATDPKPTTPATPATPAAPAAPAKPADPVTPKPGDKPTDPKAGDQHEEPDWSKAPQKWYKIYENAKGSFAKREESLKAKIRELESKPVEQAGDAGKLAILEKQLEEIRGESTNYKKQLAQLDFTKSDDYKTQFVEPANRVYRDAVGFIQRLKVAEGDGHRQATQADFDYIRNLPVDARRKAATELFGEYAPDVLDFTREIDRIKRGAEIAVERHAETHERSVLEREGTTKRQQAEYEGMRKSALEGIQSNENWGKWFREDPADPEASKLLKDGYDEIEKVMANVHTLPVDQQAAYSALYMARAAATPRLMLENNRLTAERDALREELEKIRGTDPGATGKQGMGGTGDPKQPVGIEGAAAVFDQAPR